ncbi:GTP pyrophosphokinase family protein [Microbacterium sp. NPDC056044]|uniref:GTP pyrophosphokinase n=1 Tax=Microbacterium sp. NPDC056044 TaxID=3345690 RepID=UPI0035DCD3AE
MRLPDPEDYRRLSAVLEPMGPRVAQLIRELVGALDGVPIMDVRYRLKAEASASKKIGKSGGRYRSYNDLHDMLGLRVITYLASGVDTVVEVLRDNFEVDESRSVDKLATLDPDRFGYLSYHLVLTLKPPRSDLTEWGPYRDIRFEVQVRSILQHAWAEIEHDLGYKYEPGIPSHLRRKFAILAGALESADNSFDDLAVKVAEHVATVTDAVQSGVEVSVDRDSIRALATGDSAIARADRAIADAIGASLSATIANDYAEERAGELIDLGLETTEAVGNAIEDHFEALVAFAVAWFTQARPYPDEDDPAVDEDGRFRELTPGVSLFYWYLHGVIELNDDQLLEETMLQDMDTDEGRRALRAVHDEAFTARSL